MEAYDRCCEIIEGKPLLIKSADPRLQNQTTNVVYAEGRGVPQRASLVKRLNHNIAEAKDAMPWHLKLRDALKSPAICFAAGVLSALFVVKYIGKARI